MGIKPPTEKSFMQTVIDFARLHRWLVFHNHDSRRSPEGFPDLVLSRDTTVLVAELKVKGRRTTAAQRRWLQAFARADVPAYVWRDDGESWAEIIEVLT